MQAWLNAILSHPRARESPAVRDFLVVEANMIPPQYEGVRWVKFPPVPQEPLVAAPIASGDGNTVEMEMEEMFDDDYDAPPHQQDAEDDDEFVPAASERYQQTREAVTAEDEMELTGEVEMVEDVGSLAQSMGASHLGRSLQLQAQMGHPTASNRATNAVTGLRLGGAVSPGGTPAAQGGIGSVIQNAGLPGQTPVQQQAMTSPRRLDSFTLLKVIGKGSFGKVFLAKEKSTGQIFALKVLRKDFVVRRNQVEHTKTERSVLGYVDHPFIVGMKMAFQSKDKLYFVLDYCPGGELFYHLGRLGRFPEHQARFYAAEIVLAISYVHQLDIIYRDLKPENVLLDDQGHVRLTDFGLSKEGISGSSSGANSFCGTPEYLAPEIVDRRGHGRAVDWWSLGALLYEMLKGLPPFYCQDRERLFEKIRKETLRFPPFFSASAKSVLSGLLERDPDKRLGSGPTDAEEIKAHSFFSVIDWNKLQIGEITPPWKPPVQGSADTSQFDTEFTTMPIFSPQSHQHRLGTTPAGGNHFEGFSYTNPVLFGSGSGTKI
jgi:RAC serine/threonine-protein kinase